MTAPRTDALLHGEYTPDPTAPAAEPAPAAWHPAMRVAFRFAFAYLLLYIAPLGPFGLTPLAKLVARHVFGIEGPLQTGGTGSGDRLIDWVQLLCIVVLAVVATAVWSALDRRRREYDVLHDRSRVVARYWLGLYMCTYGAAKVIQTQFPAPSLERLLEPYGQSSPMGLVWTFMGYSYAYNLFAGLGEMVGGILLFWRRTTTLGALVSAAVLSNVVTINFAYDVPVKQFSSHLLLVALLLALPDAAPLARVLLGRGAAALRDHSPRGRLWLPRKVRLALKSLVIAAGVLGPLGVSANVVWRYRASAPRPPLYGIWEVASLERNGRPVPALYTDAARWRRVIVGRGGTLSIQLANDSLLRFRVKVDTVARTLSLTPFRTLGSGQLAYARADSALTVTGTLDADTVRATLRRVDETTFLLVSRGFHWVNEVPFNR